MAIAFVTAGAGAGTETSGADLNLSCPSVVDANNILIGCVVWLDITSSPTDPSGWTQLHGPADLGTGTAVGRAWVYGKLAVGDEDSDVISFGTAGGTAGRFGRIYRFSGYSSGTLADVVPDASFTDTPSEDDPPGPTVTTTVAGALALAFIAQDDNNSLAAITGNSGGTWAVAVGNFLDAAIGAQGCALSLQSATPTGDPGTITGGLITTAADEGTTIGFEIRPNVPAAVEPPPPRTQARYGW